MTVQHDPWIEEKASQDDAIQVSNLMQKLPGLLRILGAGALIVAMYTFLARGWESGNDVFHYLLMLGHTAVLAIVGMASGHWLKESKGARLLIALALASVPVNFAILGAFLYSQLGMGHIGHYPQYVAWMSDSLSMALLTNAGALVILVPITLLGFTVLARGMSKKLSFLFLLSNAALLLPLRDPQMVSLLVIALMGGVMTFSRRAARGNVTAKTREGVIALGLQLLPLLVLMGRSLWLYSVDLFLLTIMALTVYFILRQITLYLEKESKFVNLLNLVSVIPAIFTAIFLSMAITDMTSFPLSLAVPVGVLVSAMMLYDISYRSPQSAIVYRKLSMFWVQVGFIPNLFVFTDLYAALACFVIGLGLIFLGINRQQRSVFSTGLLLMLVGGAQQIYELVKHFDLGSWAGLAIFGVVSIVVASTLESGGGKIRPRLASWKAAFSQWER